MDGTFAIPAVIRFIMATTILGGRRNNFAQCEANRANRSSRYGAPTSPAFQFFQTRIIFEIRQKGSGVEDQGISIDRDFVLSLLRVDELLKLPGSSNPVRLGKSDIA
jgi:hypothetical protein